MNSERHASGRRKMTFLFVVPTLFFAAFLLYFIIWNLYYSFLDYSILHAHNPPFVGFGTYSSVLGDPLFVTAFGRTMLWVVVCLAVTNALGILIASLIFFLENGKLKSVYNSLFLYPISISLAASAVIWTWLYNPQEGINSIFVALHLPTFSGLSSPSTSELSLIIVSIWIYSGLSAIFYYSSFQGVPSQVIESARADAAKAHTIVFKILLPEAKNAFIVATVTIFLFVLRMFSLPYVATGLDPFTMTLAEQMFNYFTTEFFSKASVVSIIVVIIAAAVIVPYALFGVKRWISGD
ncbi:MAG: sugar ABC transporter permease [Thermoplasmata archaeon]|nr:sugar ABC transporter permease [Candidatus Sysuiplasma jiujiangense]